MTKEQKLALSLQERSTAFDKIENLLLTLDSHRNFHRRVELIVIYTKSRLREIDRSPLTPSPQLTCMCDDLKCKCGGECASEATQQFDSIETELAASDHYYMCARCANYALAFGFTNCVEDL